jgi:chemotaxis protein methyltransferase CheR
MTSTLFASPTLTNDQFEKVRSLIASYAGINIAISKQQMVFNRLLRQLRVTGMDSFEQYLEQVEQSFDVRQTFVDALTTNVTSFNREQHHFQSLLEWSIKQAGLGLRLADVRGWSAGCSSGEEPTNIVMTLLEGFAQHAVPTSPIILATDIDTQVLARARLGIYPNEQIAPFSIASRERFFSKQGPTESQFKSYYRSLIEYQYLNLNAPVWQLPRMLKPRSLQFVFCRNVMIYFSAEVQRKLLRRIHEVLEPGGLLFAGHSEMLLHSDDLFESLGRTSFRARAV